MPTAAVRRRTPSARWRNCALGLALGASVAIPTAAADSLSAALARGNAALARGEPQRALSEYQTLLSARVDDPTLTYNLAMAYARLEQYGQAVRYLERTLVLSPRDSEARQQLAQVRQALGEAQASRAGEAIVSTRPPLLPSLFSHVSEDELGWVCLGASWLFCLAILTLRLARREGVRLASGILSVVSALTFAAACLGLGVKAEWGQEGRRAIILSPDAKLLEGPDPRARVIGALAEGSEARLLGREGGFAYVRDAAGRRGSLRSADVGEI